MSPLERIQTAMQNFSQQRCVFNTQQPFELSRVAVEYKGVPNSDKTFLFKDVDSVTDQSKVG